MHNENLAVASAELNTAFCDDHYFQLSLEHWLFSRRSFACILAILLFFWRNNERTEPRYCIAPRVLLSESDALYCAHFIRKLVKTKADMFQLLDFYNNWSAPGC